MDPLTIMSLIATGVGGAKSLFGQDPDPTKFNREQMAKILEDIKAQFPKLEEAYRAQAAQSQNMLTRGAMMRGAGAGLPRNIVEQNINRGQQSVRQDLNAQLGQLEAQKLGTMQNVAQLYGSMPTPPVDNSGSQLLGLGIQGLSAFSQPGDWDWLSKLFGGGGNQPATNPNIGLNMDRYYGPPQPMGLDYRKYYNTTPTKIGLDYDKYFE